MEVEFLHQKPGGALSFALPKYEVSGSTWAMRRPRLKRSIAAPDDSVTAWLTVARGILTRGPNAWVSPRVEKSIGDMVTSDLLEADDPTGAISFKLQDNPEWLHTNPLNVPYSGLGTTRQDLCESDEELKFFRELLPNQLGDVLTSLIVPQRSVETMISIEDAYKFNQQRVDFALEIEDELKVVFEVDGLQHKDDPAQNITDDKRDQALQNAGWLVFRISASSIRDDTVDGQFEKIREHILSTPLGSKYLQPSQELPGQMNALLAYRAPNAIHNLQLTLLDALQQGYISSSGIWLIEVKERDLPIAPLAIMDLADLLRDLAILWGIDFDESAIKISVERDPLADSLAKLLTDPPNVVESIPNPDLTLDVAVLGPSLGAFPNESDDSYLIRPSYLSSTNLDIQPPYGVPRPLDCNNVHAKEALHNLLQRIFRKKDFLPGQVDILLRILSKEPCIGLLPTGAGKSLCYQLAGMLQPGLVLIIDPLVSLMQDQVEGMVAQHFTCADMINRDLTSRERGIAQERFLSGETRFLFISPERLQRSEFRGTLEKVTASSIYISYVVVDEAHCISEWGHDFRPAYLNIAKNARRFCTGATGNAPSLIALTGTASRQVLMDIMRELEISEQESVIEATNFDRAELQFRIQKAVASNVADLVPAVLDSIPARVSPNLSKNDLFNPEFGGLVFTKFVNGRNPIAINNLVPALEKYFRKEIHYYSGAMPRFHSTIHGSTEWTQHKANIQTQFKQSKIPFLVSTNAFGMGIDKPNIRWTLHVGIPRSLEEFYQEAGRAGRDKQRSVCTILYSDRDQRDLDYFMNENFPGVTQEVADAEEFYHSLQTKAMKLSSQLRQSPGSNWNPADPIPMPFTTNRDRQEKAIYRLSLIGLVKDYTVENGLFMVNAQKRSDQELRDAVYAYGVSYLVNQRKELVDRFDVLCASYPPVVAALTTIIKEVYQSVRLRRQNAMNTMQELAQLHVDTDGELFRRDLLAYLQESLWYSSILNIVQSNATDPNAWQRISDQVDDPIDWHGILGDCRRLLNDYPDSNHLRILAGLGRIASNASVYDASEQIINAITSIADSQGASAAGLVSINILSTCIRISPDSRSACTQLLRAMASDGKRIDPQIIITLARMVGTSFPDKTTEAFCLAIAASALIQLSQSQFEEVLA